VWACLMLSAIAAFWTGRALMGIIALVLAVMLPVVKRKKAPKGVEGWPGAEP